MLICDSCKQNKAIGTVYLSLNHEHTTSIDICLPCLENLCNTYHFDKEKILSSLKPVNDISAKLEDNPIKTESKTETLLTSEADINTAFPTVKIGDQVWTARNLDIDDGGEGIYHLNGETYYTWDAAVRVCGKLNGWHLPTNKEWDKLIKTCGDNPAVKLKRCS